MAGVYLSESAWARLKVINNLVSGQDFGGLSPNGHGSGFGAHPMEHRIVRPTTTVTAATSYLVQWYRSTSAGTTEILSPGSTTFTAYNWWGQSLTSDSQCYAFRPTPSPRWYFFQPGGLAKDQDVLFRLTDPLTTSSTGVGAVVTEAFGPGTGVSTGTTISLHNPETKAGAYIFSGTTDARGVGMWVQNEIYMIVQMECA